MSEKMNIRLRRLMHRAKEEPKGNYYVYQWYKKLISDLNLSATEYENAIYTLSNILRV